MKHKDKNRSEFSMNKKKPLCWFYKKKNCKGRWDEEDLQSDKAAYFAMHGIGSPLNLIKEAQKEFGKGCEYFRNDIYCPYLSQINNPISLF